MSKRTFENLKYEEGEQQVFWSGVSTEDEADFNDFMLNNVSSRFYDEEADQEFENLIHELADTEFDSKNIEIILRSKVSQNRAWEIGEAIAEAYLESEHDVVWPWNMARDKRTPHASLQGADLIGFSVSGEKTHIILGEVKSSSQMRSPPQIMSSKKEHMGGQLNKLATDATVKHQIFGWLWWRCKNTNHEKKFKQAMTLYIKSGNREYILLGILIRDTEPDVLDLRKTGQNLAATITEPTICHLIAIYLPCAISDLPSRISGE